MAKFNEYILLCSFVLAEFPRIHTSGREYSYKHFIFTIRIGSTDTTLKMAIEKKVSVLCEVPAM